MHMLLSTVIYLNIIFYSFPFFFASTWWMKMISKYWRQNKKLSTPQDNEDGGLCRREIIVTGEVLGVSQCLDSTAGGDAVKLVNPVETGISLAGGGWRGRGAVGACP